MFLRKHEKYESISYQFQTNLRLLQQKGPSCDKKKHLRLAHVYLHINIKRKGNGKEPVISKTHIHH